MRFINNLWFVKCYSSLKVFHSDAQQREFLILSCDLCSDCGCVWLIVWHPVTWSSETTVSVKPLLTDIFVPLLFCVGCWQTQVFSAWKSKSRSYASGCTGCREPCCISCAVQPFSSRGGDAVRGEERVFVQYVHLPPAVCVSASDVGDHRSLWRQLSRL